MQLLRVPSARDIQAFEIINRRCTHAALDFCLPWITQVGLGGIQLPLVGLVWWTQRGGYPAVEGLPRAALLAFILSTLLVHLIKKRVKRLRPVAYTEVRFLAPVTRHGSFPSGHTATSFALALVVAWYFPAWAPALFLLAAVIGYSRVYVGLHFLSDVVAAAVIGLVSASITLLGSAA